MMQHICNVHCAREKGGWAADAIRCFVSCVITHDSLHIPVHPLLHAFFSRGSVAAWAVVLSRSFTPMPSCNFRVTLLFPQPPFPPLDASSMQAG